MTTHVEIDFETKSLTDIRTHGAFRYFEDPAAAVLIGSYSIDHGPVGRWKLGECCPLDLGTAIINGATISAHNAGFEILCFEWLHENERWPMPAYEQFRCTAATAAAMSLPRALGDLCEVLDLPVKKDKEGARLMRLFSIPDKHGQFKEMADMPVEAEGYHSYCDDDVRTEAEADKRMVPLSAFEQDVWQLSERINRRGIRIDRKSAISAIRLADKAKRLLDAEMRAVTGGAVTACSQVSKLLSWVQEQGVMLSSAAKAELTDALEGPQLPAHVRKALEIRQEAAKTSVSKLSAMLKRASADGRVRGTFMYHGASTGRWVNTGVNFANMPRPRRIYEDSKVRTDVLFRAFRTEDPAFLRELYGPDLGRPLHLVSDAIRGFIWAGPGNELVQADYSGIEGAVIAWLANEEWKLAEMFKIIADPKNNADMYRQTAAGILNLPIEVVDKKHWGRQAVGKTSELALGFQGGVSAFYTMAKNYGVDLDAIYAPVWETASAELREKVVRRHANQLKRKMSRADQLSKEAWLACEIIKTGWRKQNAAIAASWNDAEAAVRAAVSEPGKVTEAARCRFVVKLGYLWTMLPSGRCLCYPAPKLKDQVWAELKFDDGTWSDAEVLERDKAEDMELAGTARIKGDTSAKVTFLGIGDNKKMRRQPLYGGLIMQNNTQATARDLLVNGMLKAEAAGYPVIAHVYDEMICEVPRGFGDLATFERLICELPDWAAGMPLTAGGWRGKRYRKD